MIVSHINNVEYRPISYLAREREKLSLRSEYDLSIHLGRVTHMGLSCRSMLIHVTADKSCCLARLSLNVLKWRTTILVHEFTFLDIVEEQPQSSYA